VTVVVGGHGADHGTTSSDPIIAALERARGVVPDQGPIGVFIHHNTLHAYQHLPFHDGVQAGAAALGARPYLSLEEFRALWRRGRVADDDLRVEVVRALGARGHDEVLPGLSRERLWYRLLVSELDTDDAPGLEFAIRHGLVPVRESDALWQNCVARVGAGVSHRVHTPAATRHRDVLVARGGADTDAVVHPELIRLAAGYLDEGHAHQTIPDRAQGVLRAACGLYARGLPAPRACRGVEHDAQAVLRDRTPAREVIAASLGALGVADEALDEFLFATTLALPGWTGMFARLERHPDEHDDAAAPASLIEFVAVRLLLERRAVEHAAEAIGAPVAWSALRTRMPAAAPRPPVLDAARLWDLARAATLDAGAVAALSDADLAELWRACDESTDVQRRRIFQEAYERTYRQAILDGMAERRTWGVETSRERPRAQFVFCIDEREESIRRALEEQDPRFLTYGAAGFFGVAIDYQGLEDREPAAHCPVVVTPAHEVHEQPLFTHLSWHRFWNRLRDEWHAWQRKATAASRTLTGGAGVSFILGPAAALRTVAHVMAPRHSHRVGTTLRSAIVPRPATRLSTLRSTADGPAPRGKPVGFSLEESVDRVTATLMNAGMVRDFAPIVVMLGHGSTSLNNPHESAHDCGACGGRRGGANARLFADMANRADVREGVRRKGIDIPADTWFVGALHDTASDEVRYYDLEMLPSAQAGAFEAAFAALEQARRYSALERCRRFDDAPLTLTPDAALRHVEARSSSLAQVRPEYGHCTNATCIVGRRELIRGLHLDRRAFLVSYDPTIDSANTIIERVLAAVGPVGAGISLEYYFSSVDNEVFGCGTKLPHNVTGLIGVMNGHQSDLRTGLPIQMVEIHEPMRLLVVVDATPEALLFVAGRQPEVAELVGKAWVQLVSVHPETGAMSVFEDGAFVPYTPRATRLPVVEHSPDWHMRTRDHVPPALVRSALPERHLPADVSEALVAPALQS
jgi:uncharacterized protein YbcC (UPF0753/DUF2309 family)